MSYVIETGIPIPPFNANGRKLVPLLFCAVFYTIRTAEGYMADKASLEKHIAARREEETSAYRGLHYYHPTETVGRILGRALVSVTPMPTCGRQHLTCRLRCSAACSRGSAGSSISRLCRQPSRSIFPADN